MTVRIYFTGQHFTILPPLFYADVEKGALPFDVPRSRDGWFHHQDQSFKHFLEDYNAAAHKYRKTHPDWEDPIWDDSHRLECELA